VEKISMRNVALVVALSLSLSFAQESQMLPPLVPVVEQEQCERTYNINELLFKIKENFPKQFLKTESESFQTLHTAICISTHMASTWG